ncbi:hypothetical protein OEZ85_009626 [Tetradesmus obliquus]|uniref:Uncharacterized protein n=1 Tax=Tetradesmus obliquus TaxID=3088 RepID=A0ABY8UA11_TETOB|nr:hypothetical protein OEZ85_009626 [Tetradesmus obliquus]
MTRLAPIGQRANRSYPPDRTLYYALGPNSDGLELVRAMRGSNKNEAVNKPAAGGRGNGNRRATEVGGGRGKGGAGGKKVCVPCTMVKLQLTSPKAARAHAEAVIVDGQHQRPANRQHPERGGCVHCKCEDCQKVFRREGASPAEFKKTWETYLECLNVRARLLVLQREGAMASVAEQQQLKKEQLLASLGQLLAGQSPDIQAAAILAVGNLNVLTCATLMEREEDVRRAAVMQLVQQATAPAPAAAAPAATGVSEERVLELVSEQAQQLQEHINSSLAESMQRMQEGLLSFISTRLAQSAGRRCLPTISESGESLGDAVCVTGTKYIKA